MINFEPVDPLELQKEKFRGKFSWVEDGETVFIQPESNYKALDMIADKLRTKNMKKFPKEMVKIGALVAAPYFEEYYRGKIISIKPNKIKVLFVDWGNKETLEEAALRELPEELRLIENQCLKAKLYLTKPIRNQNYLERIRGELMNEEEYLFKKEVGEFISSYKNK